MATTSNRALIVPATGDLVDTWGENALNPNFIQLDGMMSGVQSISLSNVNVSLSIASGTITPAAGPNQSSNAVIKFSGTLTGNVVVTFPAPGFWICQNLCSGNFHVQLRAAGTGNMIGLPPGQAVHVWNNGTDCDFANMPVVGSYLDIATNTTPKWMTACSVLPYLLCDGATYTASIYSTLFALLGSTFGGNGITTFAVPDLRSRTRVALETGTAVSRLTFPIAGVTGTLLGASGGSQLVQAHTHTSQLTDPGHKHNISGGGDSAQDLATVRASNELTTSTTSIGTATTGISIIVGTALVNGTTTIISGSSGNVQPTFVAGLTFVKT